MVAMGTRRPRSGLRLCRRWALHRRGNRPRLREIWRATNCDKLSEMCISHMPSLKAKKLGKLTQS